MALTNSQTTILKAYINTSPDLSIQPIRADGANEIARLLNLEASPTFIVWKTSVPITEVGDAILATAINSSSALQLQRLQAVTGDLSGGFINPSKSDRRSIFDLIFSGTGAEATTRANLLTLWKRPALRIEKVFTTGIGSDVSPAIMTFEGTIDYQDVVQARR